MWDGDMTRVTSTVRIRARDDDAGRDNTKGIGGTYVRTGQGRMRRCSARDHTILRTCTFWITKRRKGRREGNIGKITHMNKNVKK